MSLDDILKQQEVDRRDNTRNPDLNREHRGHDGRSLNERVRALEGRLDNLCRSTGDYAARVRDLEERNSLTEASLTCQAGRMKKLVEDRVGLTLAELDRGMGVSRIYRLEHANAFPVIKEAIAKATPAIVAGAQTDAALDQVAGALDQVAAAGREHAEPPRAPTSVETFEDGSAVVIMDDGQRVFLKAALVRTRKGRPDEETAEPRKPELAEAALCIQAARRAVSGGESPHVTKGLLDKALDAIEGRTEESDARASEPSGYNEHLGRASYGSQWFIVERRPDGSISLHKEVGND